MTCHVRMIEARAVRTSVGVIARRAVPTVSGIARTAVQAWSIVIACGIGIAVVRLVSVAIEYLGARAASRSVPGAAGALVGVGSRVCARACCSSSTRISNTVVDVDAGNAITVPAGRAVIAGEAIIRRWHVMTYHLRMIEARAVRTPVGVGARCAGCTRFRAD